MGFTQSHILLWLLTACTLTTQELVKLSVSHKISAECGKRVILTCEVSSSTHQLSIKRMEWSQGKTSLCVMDGEGNITRHNHTSGLHCMYQDGHLSLVLHKVQPLDSGASNRYMCKLQSNKGVAHEYTTVELKECASVKGVWTRDGPSCTFSHVYPDGDVHWFLGTHNLSDGSLKHNTTKHVVGGGWLTIHSTLEKKSSDARYNCSLRSTKSGTYIASTVVQKKVRLIIDPEWETTYRVKGAAGSSGSTGTFLCISVFLAAVLAQ